jgi:hypothetical protein
LLLATSAARSEAPPPELARMLERALDEAERVRLEFRTVEYDATMRVQEWDSSGRLRGTARATAIMRPGAAEPMTFVSREVNGKVRLPEPGKRKRKKRTDNKSLHQFAEEHRIAQRFTFTDRGSEIVAGQRVRRITFTPNHTQRAGSNAARFMDAISGTGWISESTNRIVKFEMRLDRPHQLFWIIAVLKDLEIRYEQLQHGSTLGRSKLQVAFSLTTPVSTLRQQHDVQLDNFRPRQQQQPGVTTASR